MNYVHEPDFDPLKAIIDLEAQGRHRQPGPVSQEAAKEFDRANTVPKHRAVQEALRPMGERSLAQTGVRVVKKP